MQRQLTLHVSALNDAEYELYTAGIADLLLLDKYNEHANDDAYWENVNVGVKETWAWLRGRYGHLDTADIDTVSRTVYAVFLINLCSPVSATDP
jgi:hypothetical protein